MPRLLLRSASSDEISLLKTLLTIANPEQIRPTAVAHSHLLYPFWTVTPSWTALAQSFYNGTLDFQRISAVQSLLEGLATRVVYSGSHGEDDCGPVIYVQKHYSDAAATILKHLKIDISSLALNLCIDHSEITDQ